MSVRRLNVREREELLTCGLLQMLRTDVEHVLKEKNCTLTNLSGRNNSFFRPNWRKIDKWPKMGLNGPKTGGDRRVSLQTGRKSDGACVRH